MARNTDTAARIVKPENWEEDSSPQQMQKIGNLFCDMLGLPRNAAHPGKPNGYVQRGPAGALIEHLSQRALDAKGKPTSAPLHKVTCSGWKLPSKPTTAEPAESLEERIERMTPEQKAAILALLQSDAPAPTAEGIRQGRGGRVRIARS